MPNPALAGLWPALSAPGVGHKPACLHPSAALSAAAASPRDGGLATVAPREPLIDDPRVRVDDSTCVAHSCLDRCLANLCDDSTRVQSGSELVEAAKANHAFLRARGPNPWHGFCFSMDWQSDVDLAWLVIQNAGGPHGYPNCFTLVQLDGFTFVEKGCALDRSVWRSTDAHGTGGKLTSVLCRVTTTELTMP